MGKRIMVVDDDQAMLTLVGLILEQAGFVVQKAKSGLEALELLNSSPPDLFILDIMMPGMDGIELCQRIRANPLTAETPVLFLSALSDFHVVEKGFEAGATDHLAKPVSNRTLLAKVNGVIGAGRNAHQDRYLCSGLQ